MARALDRKIMEETNFAQSLSHGDVTAVLGELPAVLFALTRLTTTLQTRQIGRLEFIQLSDDLTAVAGRAPRLGGVIRRAADAASDAAPFVEQLGLLIEIRQLLAGGGRCDSSRVTLTPCSVLPSTPDAVHQSETDDQPGGVPTAEEFAMAMCGSAAFLHPNCPAGISLR
jgi:hypothetical protein